MFVSSGRAVRAALFSIALGTFVASANAQQASFTLPFETHWNNAVLPAGDYRMSTVSTMYPKVFSVTGQGKSFYILAGVGNAGEDSETNSYLRVENAGNLHVVREYVSGFTGKTYHFTTPKNIQTQLAAAGSSQQEISNVAVIARH